MKLDAVKFLVDADVLSEPTKSAPDARAIEWLRRHELELTRKWG